VAEQNPLIEQGEQEPAANRRPVINSRILERVLAERNTFAEQSAAEREAEINRNRARPVPPHIRRAIRLAETFANAHRYIAGAARDAVRPASCEQRVHRRGRSPSGRPAARAARRGDSGDGTDSSDSDGDSESPGVGRALSAAWIRATHPP
jgi:hypothetical protein